jgi:hypothetical protein
MAIWVERRELIRVELVRESAVEDGRELVNLRDRRERLDEVDGAPETRRGSGEGGAGRFDMRESRERRELRVRDCRKVWENGLAGGV